MKRYIHIFTFIVLFAILHSFCYRILEKQAVYTQNTEPITPTTKIYDIGHRYLPNLSKINFISDLFVFVYLIPLFLFPNKNMIEEFIIYFLCVFVIRDIIMVSTVLPKDKSCQLHNQKLKYFYHGSCYDKVVSGHFSVVMLLSFLYYKYNIVSNVQLLVILNIINAFLIVSVRNHYTVDIILAVFVSAVVIYKFNEKSIKCNTVNV